MLAPSSRPYILFSQAIVKDDLQTVKPVRRGMLLFPVIGFRALRGRPNKADRRVVVGPLQARVKLGAEIKDLCAGIVYRHVSPSQTTTLFPSQA
jgi:hypothetical protein